MATEKFRPAKFLQLKSLIPGAKVPINLMTGQVFMNFRAQNRNFSVSRPLVVDSFMKFLQKSIKT